MRRGSDRTGGVAGFTLLEVMVAVLVLGIAMTSLLYTQAQCIRAQAQTQNVTLATMKAREIADQVLMDRSMLPMQGETKEVLFDPPYDFLHGAVRVEANELLPVINEVFITVSWGEDSSRRESRPSASHSAGRVRSVEICFYITPLEQQPTTMGPIT